MVASMARGASLDPPSASLPDLAIPDRRRRQESAVLLYFSEEV
jgi:hypothetical protein